MKRSIVRLGTACLLLLCLSFVPATAQKVPKFDTRPPWADSPTTEKAWGTMPQPFVLKRPGRYTWSDWRQLIDSAWGPGLPTAQKLQTFDTYWNKVDQIWGGFPNLVVNWDSLRDVYRPMVAAGVSRGRFAGILCRLTRALNEWHVFADDTGIDSTMGITGSSAEYPNYPSFNYVPGAPLFCINGSFRTHFGAGVTSIGDSLAMVYSVMPNHPLDLQPGDIILGYDGVPWKQLARELLDAEIPILGGGSILGSTPAAADHMTMLSVGANWGLFDTIDVMRYSDRVKIVHYPTALLNSIAPPYHIATEQLPVKGVAFPNIEANELVSWGVVDGTSIGYVYVWDWLGVPDGKTGVQFARAIDDLLHTRDVTGLILDFRYNGGGWEHYANDGFKHLFNIDPTNNYSRAWRTPGDDHFLFTITPAYGPDFFTPTPEIFDHPIAVLTGPNCGSAGDYNAFRLRFHPMVRFFGEPTAGAYTDLDHNPYFYSSYYLCRVDPAGTYSNYNNEAYMIHKPFAVDEEVWLTQEGVADGEDDVVKRAIEWMTTLTYAHDASALNRYARPGVDSVTVTAVLTDPGNRSMSASLVMKNLNGVAQDSAAMMNDGLHGDGLPGDSILGARFRAPAAEGFYTFDLQTDDPWIHSSRLLPKVTFMTTAGPAICVGDTAYADPHWGASVNFRLKVNNQSSTTALPAIGGTIRALDTAAIAYGNPFSVGDLAPAQTRLSTQIRISFSQWGAGLQDIPFELVFSSQGIEYWVDTIQIGVTPVVGIAQETIVPARYQLDQNYPNPFNPSTTIKYGLPERSHVTLTVFNTLGQQVAQLVNGEQEAGFHEIKFEGSGLSSGVYLYRMQAGSYVETCKLILLK